MTVLFTAAGVLVAALAGALLWRCRQRNVSRWLPAYVKGDWAGRRERRKPREGPVHILFCVADHFEPGLGHAGLEAQRRRISHWLESYPKLAREFRDADGLHPRHTFFYPSEQYRPEHLERLAQLVEAGYGEVEVHLHHDRDSSQGLRRNLQTFVGRLGRHGLLGREMGSGQPGFAFVHGNWALDNSRPDGRWCGVTDELLVLRESGCFADFTLPSAPSATQTRRINSIYYAFDDPSRPRSHDDGVEVRVGGTETGDLLIVQGPLGMRWPGGKFSLLPRLENGNLAGHAPPSPRRFRAWLETRVCVAGRPEWVFVKVHTHGCDERNWEALLGEPMRAFHRCLAREYNDGTRYRLHYVTARECFNIVKAAERGLTGDPGRYRDLELLPPPVACTTPVPPAEVQLSGG